MLLGPKTKTFYSSKRTDCSQKRSLNILPKAFNFGYGPADQAGLAKGHRTPETPEHTTWSTQGSTLLSRPAILFLSSLRNDGCQK